MSYEILDKINSIDDFKALPDGDMLPLCEELRAFLKEKVQKCGGHLASNLGVVELSVALHRVFDSPKDKIIFDVGHQSYVHKILTGRKDRFDELRTPGGLSGFTQMQESEHDAFGAGHSSTSISAALGYAEAMALRGENNHTVCVIGDGAYTGGMVHEAINNCRPELGLVVILNENGMSISSNKGAFASYLSDVRSSEGYRGIKDRTRSFFNHIPLLGKPIIWVLALIKRLLKKLLFTANYFEDLGFYYLGPIDGNDYKKVEAALLKAKKMNKCVFVHLITTKGKGYEEAEKNPDLYHSVKHSGGENSSFHGVFADEFLRMADRDDKVVAITAAMGLGTGLSAFGEKYPDRYFDVGIAEEHALTFAGGLSAAGHKPYAAIYSTFLQRGYDNIVHDIALQNLPVRIIIDRAGLAVSDGATHHGIFDVAFLSHIPNMRIYSPYCYSSLRGVLKASLDTEGPLAIRYPNSAEGECVSTHPFTKLGGGEVSVDFDLSIPQKNVIVTYGGITEKVLLAKKILEGQGIAVGVIAVELIKPYAPAVEIIEKVMRGGARVLYVEEGIKNGGAAMITKNMLSERGVDTRDFAIFAIDDDFANPREKCDLYDYVGLSSEKIADYFLGHR